MQSSGPTSNSGMWQIGRTRVGIFKYHHPFLALLFYRNKSCSPFIPSDLIQRDQVLLSEHVVRKSQFFPYSGYFSSVTLNTHICRIGPMLLWDSSPTLLDPPNGFLTFLRDRTEDIITCIQTYPQGNER